MGGSTQACDEGIKLEEEQQNGKEMMLLLDNVKV
jgi:hypothetical protein